jgi:hypothetical protein
VPAVNAVIELANIPAPAPSDVLLFSTVAPAEMYQHTPFTVTEAPPSLVTFPPLVAVVCVIAEAVAVVIIGGVISFLHECVKEIERNNRITGESLNVFFIMT